MHRYLIAAVMFAVGIQPANACWNSTATDALQIKHLNTMLMATALRCRNTSDDFLSEYNRFVNKYNGLIGQQNGIVRAELAKTLGPQGALEQSDNLSVGFANTYGAGHPDMDCAALKNLVQDIANGDENATTLSDLADRVVVRSEIPGAICTIDQKN